MAGFNIQKNSGLNLEHAYSTDPDVMKSFYYLLQIAHLFLQMFEMGSLLRRLAQDYSASPRQLFGSLKNLAKRLLDCFRYFQLDDEAFEITSGQIRLCDPGWPLLPGSGSIFQTAEHLRPNAFAQGGVPLPPENSQPLTTNSRHSSIIRFGGLFLDAGRESPTLPHTLKAHYTTESGWHVRFRELIGIRWAKKLHVRAAGARRARAICAFQVLGHVAESAIPELTRRMREGEPSYPIISSLPVIDPQAFLKCGALTHPNPTNRMYAVGALNLGFGLSNATPILPTVIKCLEDENGNVRSAAAGLLGYWGHQQPEVAVLALLRALEDSYYQVRGTAVHHLAGYAGESPEVISAMRKHLFDPDSRIRIDTKTALRRAEANQTK